MRVAYRVLLLLEGRSRLYEAGNGLSWLRISLNELLTAGVSSPRGEA
jgi:hypothetical protein